MQIIRIPTPMGGPKRIVLTVSGVSAYLPEWEHASGIDRRALAGRVRKWKDPAIVFGSKHRGKRINPNPNWTSIVSKVRAVPVPTRPANIQGWGW